MFNHLMIMLFISSSCFFYIASAKPNLRSMTDEQMSKTSGQALLSLAYLAPTDGDNLITKHTNNSNIGFYKLGLEAEAEINVNIRNIQFGCGGTNGAGECDIDIKNLSLSGLPIGYTPRSADSPNFTAKARPSTSAVLTNPFIEFAIKNPNSSAVRKVIGMRFSAERMNALLSA